MSPGLLDTPKRASGGPFWPRALFSTPPGNRKSASPSCYFLPPRRDPPRKPHMAIIYIFPTFFDDFAADRSEKVPPGTPLLLNGPPPGPSEAPPRIATAPLGPQISGKTPSGPPLGVI